MKIKTSLSVFCVLFCMAFVFVKMEPIDFPNYFPKPSYNFEKNPLRMEKIQLGRALFYDPILSKDSTISCASCHSPYNGFAHTDHDLSHGISDIIGTRNAPALFNLAWQKSFMWDGAVNHLDMQALAPISHPSEMAESIEHVVQKVQKKALYQPLFLAAYSDTLVTGTRILKALSQFQLTLVSANSKYDKVQRKEESFTNQEQNGYVLFKENCNVCHREPLFSNYAFANNGLPLDTTLNDYGKGAISLKFADSLLFKTPSLRNLSYTYPYMHDGRFKKLRQVINHYTMGIVGHKTLSKPLINKIALNPNEKTDLISFLLTLDDKDFIFDKKNKFPRELFFHEK